MCRWTQNDVRNKEQRKAEKTTKEESDREEETTELSC